MASAEDRASLTGAFFANKKKKSSTARKKKFNSFNANKIDISTAFTSAIHVDAPEILSASELEHGMSAISGLTDFAGQFVGGTAYDGLVCVDGAMSSLSGVGGGDELWADVAQVTGWGNNHRKNAAVTGSSLTNDTSGADNKVAELMYMQALHVRRHTQDDVAERLRIEETKAKLVRAKEGMAREAERLEAEREAMVATKRSNDYGDGLQLGGGDGVSISESCKWLHSNANFSTVMRACNNSRGPMPIDGFTQAGRFPGFQKAVDTASEELFPGLAEAEKILAEKEREAKASSSSMSSAHMVTWAPAGLASRMSEESGTASVQIPLNLDPPPIGRRLNLLIGPEVEKGTVGNDEPTRTTTPMDAATTTVKEKQPLKKDTLKKKKKKDLSTFKTTP